MMSDFDHSDQGSISMLYHLRRCRASVGVTTLLLSCVTYVLLVHTLNTSSKMLDIHPQPVTNIHVKDYPNDDTPASNLENQNAKLALLKNMDIHSKQIRTNVKPKHSTHRQSNVYGEKAKYDMDNRPANTTETTMLHEHDYTTKQQYHNISSREHNRMPPFVHTYAEARRVLKDYVYEDIMNMKPIRFLPNFKNPCWLGTDDNGPINDNKVHCLPYFFLIGVKKCGTSDLFSRITRHPDVTSSFKEAQWFPRLRFMYQLKSRILKKAGVRSDPRELQTYIGMFNQVTARIVSAGKQNGRNVSEMVTGDGTPANLHLQGVWDLLPGNKGLSEPHYTNLHYIKHLIPQAKIIIIFRNPTDRLYSDFLHHRGRSADVFHDKTKTMVDVYTKCFQEHTIRQCIYNHSFTDTHPTRFTPASGFYAFFMKEIRAVFPSSQILPLMFEDHIQRPEVTMKKVFEFLELQSLGNDQLRRLINGQVRNSGAKRHSKTGPMLNKTRTMLNEFYRSSNEEMAKHMNDRRYLFSEE